MKKINWKKKCRAAGRMAIAALTMFFLKANTVYASGISQSKLATGTQKLIGDATSWLMILAPVVAGLLIIYFFEEVLRMRWTRRSGTTESWLPLCPVSEQSLEVPHSISLLDITSKITLSNHGKGKEWIRTKMKRRDRQN